jgi:hypothetical protein
MTAPRRTPPRPPLDLARVRVFPLQQRASLSSADAILVDPAAAPPPATPALEAAVEATAAEVRAARRRGACVMLIYGAHLLRSGAALILDRLMAGGWLTHLATNGAGSIHDWEYAWLGRSTESVRDGVARGCFGTWDETGRCIMLALAAGNAAEEGYGRALGRFIAQDGLALPDPAALEDLIRRDPAAALAPARAELAALMRRLGLGEGRIDITHRWKRASVLASAFARGVPLTVHPGIGYDIIATHPMYSGAAVGRAAGRDFAAFAGAVEGLDGGVVLSVGSAVMGPQVFEKALSCVNNLRVQDGRPVVAGHAITVVDLQDGGGWDWSAGEPPKTNPAYYLRFCKSFSRMGAPLRYVQGDNLAFVHRLLRRLEGADA